MKSAGGNCIELIEAMHNKETIDFLKGACVSKLSEKYIVNGNNCVDILRDVRDNSEIKQAQICKMIGMKESVLSRKISGKNKSSAKDFADILNAFGYKLVITKENE